MLAAAQANIPPELRQRLEVVAGSVKPLGLTGFGKDNKPTVKFLTYPSGLATDYQVVFCGNVLTVNRVRRRATVYSYRLPVGVEIVAVEYLQTLASKFGLAVLYNDGDQAFLARLVHNGDKLKSVHETVIPYPGSCLKVVIDDVDIVQTAASLNERMRQWCNIVVVGTQFGHAYVFYLPENPDWTPETQPEARKLTDALFSFHRGKKFLYRVEGRHDVVKEPSEVRVTSIAYIPRSCDLLLGLSFGGIVQVGFTPTGDIAANVFQCSSPVCHLVPMLPHDDPNMNVWFWAFHGERGKTVVMVLYEGSYRVVGQENVPTRDREFRKAMFYPRMADQLAGKGTTAEWICAHTLARERKLDDLTRIGDTAGPNSTLNDTDLDISQIFFSYIDARGITKFGIFDLNTYYYKRLNERPIPDSTPAKQCPYLIDVALESTETAKSLENITDIMVDCSYITRFQFLADDPEQQIYASGLNLNRIYVGSFTASATFQLRSLPSQVLESIYENLNSYTRNWRDAAQGLLAVGLMPLPLEVSASVQGGSASTLLYGVTSYEMVMTAAILYGYTDSVVDLIKETKDANWSSVRNKSEWMWLEIQRARNKVDILNDVLFSEAAKELSVDQKRQLRQLNAVLRSAKRIYRAIQEKYIEWEKADIVPRVLVLEIESQLAAVNNVSDFSNCIRNLYTMKYLPLGERNTEERQILEDMVHERRKKLRNLPSPRNLFIDDIVAKMQKIEPEEPFWLDQEGEEWYPPAVHNAVTPLLKATYHDRLKQEFIIYYTIDLVMAKKTLQAGINEPDMRKIIFHVTEILDDVLRIEEKEIKAVFDKWHREQKLVVKEVVEEPMAVSHTVMEVLEMKLGSLLKKAEKLTEEEESNLKALCNKIPYGQFRYQLYLIERSRYNDVEILTVPSNVHNRHVELYAKALPAIRKVKQYLQPLVRVNNGPQFPQEVVEKFGLFVPSEKPLAIQGKRAAAGANVPLYKRVRKLPVVERLAVEPEEVEICQVQEVVSTPQRGDETEVPVTPVMNKLDEETKQKISSILRTPTSRRARAAAAAEGQTGVEVTPETQVFLPAPHSILKTPIRRGEHTTPSRGRLRWDPEFVEPSIDNITVSSVTESSKHVAFETLPEPVNPEEVSQTVEEQSENSNEDEEDSDSSIGSGKESEPILEKLEDVESESVSQTIEEQSDGSVDGEGDVEIYEDTRKETEQVVEDQEEETEQIENVAALGEESGEEEQKGEVDKPEIVQTPDQTTAVRLVDYSIAETTFAATPTRTNIEKTVLSRKWIEDDGIERSFEQQEDETEEKTDKTGTVTVTTARVVVETIETAPAAVSGAPSPESTVRAEEPTIPKNPQIRKPSPGQTIASCLRVTKSPLRARLIRNPLREEPNPLEVKRAHSSISESADVGASAAETAVETRRSARKRTPSRTESVPEKMVRRALFGKEEPREESTEQSTSWVTRVRTPTRRPSEEVEPEQSGGRKSSLRRTRTPSVSNPVEVEATSSRKSPSRRARSVSKTAEEEPKTSTRRSTRTKTPVLDTVTEDSAEPKSAARSRTRSVSRTDHGEATTPTRRSRTRTPSEAQEGTATPTRRSTRNKTPVLPAATEGTTEPKSTGRVSEPVTETEAPPRKRGRPPKTEGTSLVAQFRANLAKRTAPRRNIAAASTSAENNEAPGSSRRSRTNSGSSSEPAPKVKKSPGRPRKNPNDYGRTTNIETD